MFCDASMLVELCKIAEVHFRLLGTNGFHVKAENERITDASSKYVNFTAPFGRQRLRASYKATKHTERTFLISDYS